MRQPLTREAISTAAREILISEGLQGVSLRKVAARLGVTAPALYAHVVDKRDLLQGIAEQEIEQILDRFRSLDGHDDPMDRLTEQCRSYLGWATRNPDLFRAMFLFRPELTSESGADGVAPGGRILEELVRSMREADRAGRLGDGCDPDDGALVLWSALHGAACMLVAGPPVEIERRARLGDAVIETVLTGLRDGARVSA